MRTSCRAGLLAAAGVVMSAAGAVAQGFGGPGFGGPATFMGAQRPNPMGLLMRPEVQSEIHLDLKQKNDLKEVQNSAGQLMLDRMRQNFQGLQNLTPEQRQQKMLEMRETMPQQMAQFQGELTQKVDAILRPEQKKRLHELDLQFRGPLAMADPAVADEVNLSQETRQKIARINAEYMSQVQEIMQEFMQDMRESSGLVPGGPGQVPAPGAPPPPPSASTQSGSTPTLAAFQIPQRQQGQRPGRFNRGGRGQGGPPNMQAIFAPYQKKLEPLKVEFEKKALDALKADEKQRWTAAQGEPFKFRSDTSGRSRG